jgi:sulfate transporter 4
LKLGRGARCLDLPPAHHPITPSHPPTRPPAHRQNIFDWYEVDPPSKTPQIKAIGTIPSGLPGWTAGWWTPLINPGEQLLLAAIICIIDVAESMAIAKALAQQNKYQLAASQELRGLGIANIAGAAFNCYTTTGSFSRSAVNDATGAKTPLAGFITGISVMLTLLFLTPVFTHMSKNVQGAIIIVGVLGLFQWEDFFLCWRVSKLDWLVWVATFLATLFAGVEIGLGVGLGLSLVLVLYKTSFPRIVEVGRLPGTSIYRNVKQYVDAESPRGLVLLRIDAPIFFANIEGIKDFLLAKLAKRRAEAERHGARVRFVVVDLSPSPTIDYAGALFLEELVADLKRDAVRLLLANPTTGVLVILKRAGVLAELGDGGVQVSVGEAVEWAQELLAAEAEGGAGI